MMTATETPERTSVARSALPLRDEPTFDLESADASSASASPRQRALRYRLVRLRDRLPVGCAAGILLGTYVGAERSDALLDVAGSAALGAVVGVTLLALLLLVRPPQ